MSEILLSRENQLLNKIVLIDGFSSSGKPLCSAICSLDKAEI